MNEVIVDKSRLKNLFYLYRKYFHVTINRRNNQKINVKIELCEKKSEFLTIATKKYTMIPGW